MKKLLISIYCIFIVFMLSSCNLQEKTNPMIFMARLKDNYPGLIVSESDLYRDDNIYFCFPGDSENNYAVKFYVDSDDNIKKICLFCNNAKKTENIISFSEAIISTYVPSENITEIMSALFKSERDYHNTQWYRYSSSMIESTVFFSVENMKISTASDAELTLKTNDITFR